MIYLLFLPDGIMFIVGLFVLAVIVVTWMYRPSLRRAAVSPDPVTIDGKEVYLALRSLCVDGFNSHHRNKVIEACKVAAFPVWEEQVNAIVNTMYDQDKPDPVLAYYHISNLAFPFDFIPWEGAEQAVEAMFANRGDAVPISFPANALHYLTKESPTAGDVRAAYIICTDNGMSDPNYYISEMIYQDVLEEPVLTMTGFCEGHIAELV